MGVYRATVDLGFAAGSGRGTNTWCLRTVDTDTEDEISVLMARVQQFYGALALVVPDSYAFRWDGQVRQLGVSDPELLPQQDPWETFGAGASGPAYTGAASMACVTWRTSLATRSGRGRTFIGPLRPAAVQADGTLDGEALSSLRQAAATLIDRSDEIATLGAIAVWSDRLQQARDIIGSSVTDQVAVLRSRRG